MVKGETGLYIYPAKEIQKMDQEADQLGLPTFTLMETAGTALFYAIKKYITKSSRILVLSGKGNNGGDGIVLARLLKINGYQVDLVFPLGTPESRCATAHFKYYQQVGYDVGEISHSYDVIVDALLGIGIRYPLREEIKQWIDWINCEKAWKVSVDIPSGVQADSGKVEAAVSADLTLSLHGLKPSAFLEPSMDFYGEKKCLSIGLPQMGSWKCWTKADTQERFFHRNNNMHKGSFGTGLLIAGTDEMPGCAILSATAAMRAGIGKLTVGTTKYVAQVIAAHLSECSYRYDVWHGCFTQEAFASYQAIAIGPGLDHIPNLQEKIDDFLAMDIPLLLDAAALQKRVYSVKKRKGAVVLTPHPKEMSRITGYSVLYVQENRLAVAADYAQKNHVIIVLKGRKTVCAFPNGRVFVIETGNVGLAKGGTGDTLTGILLAFLSYYSDVEAAVCNAVYLHGQCADYWAQTAAKTTMLATDLIGQLPVVMKKFESASPDVI